MHNGLRLGALAACLAGSCACTPSPQPPTPAPTMPTVSQAAGPATKAPAKPDAAPVGTPQASDEATPATAEAVVRAYYAAINASDYASAYAQWGDGGAASGQSLENFRKGYANTRSVEATVGTATAEEGAAGSHYILVPVELHSRQRDGSTRSYRGFFTLRAVMADGASAEQRRWHLQSAEIQRLPD